MDQKNHINIGIIGCGRVATAVHIPLLNAMTGVRIVAAADPDPQALQRIGSVSPSARLMADAHEVLASEDIEAVVITAPTALHADLAEAAFARKKHVYLEKPIAHDLESGHRVVESWRASGCVGMCGFNYRFNPLYEELRRVIAEAPFGPVIGIRSTFSTITRPAPSWTERRSTGGGVLLDLASHHIDLIRFLFGQEITQVVCSGSSGIREQDTAFLQLRLSGGITAQCAFSSNSVEEDSFEVLCQRGKLTVNRYSSTTVRHVQASAAGARMRALRENLRALKASPYLLRKVRSAWNEPSYAMALDRFVAACRGQAGDFPSLTDGLASLQVIAAAEESLQTGSLIELASPEIEKNALSTPANAQCEAGSLGIVVESSPSFSGSVVLVTPDNFETVRKTIEHLRRQTIAHQLELIIARPSRDDFGKEESEFSEFGAVRFVDIDGALSIDRARAIAVGVARGPIVLFGEDHSFPEPQWAEAHVAGHRNGHAVVGSAILNANAGSLLGWVSHLLAFGRWNEKKQSGTTDCVAWHNASYDRDILLAYGEGLTSMLVVEGLLQEQILARGQTIYFSAEARTRHVNVALPRSVLIDQFHSGRTFGASRVATGNWSWPHRIVYSVASPLIPLRRMPQVMSDLRDCAQDAPPAPLLVPLLFAGVVIHTVGEVAAYLFGDGGSTQIKAGLESHRDHHVSAKERQELFA